jgi:hypothetical protein
VNALWAATSRSAIRPVRGWLPARRKVRSIVGSRDTLHGAHRLPAHREQKGIQKDIKVFLQSDCYGHMTRGGHELPKVSPGPTMPNPFTSMSGPPLKQPYGRFRDDLLAGVVCLQGGWPAAIFYPLGHPMQYAYALRKRLRPLVEVDSVKSKPICLRFAHGRTCRRPTFAWRVHGPPRPPSSYAPGPEQNLASLFFQV